MVVVGLVAKELLRLLLSRDVEEVALQRQRLPGRPRNRPGLVVDPDDAAVAGDHAILQRQPVAVVRATVRVEHALPVVGVQHPYEELAILRPLGRRISEHRLDLRARVDIGACVVDRVDVDDERKLLDECPELLLGRPQPLLAASSVADVADRGGEDRWPGKLEPCDGDLDGELVALRVPGDDLDAPAHEGTATVHRWAVDPAREPAPVGLPARGGDDQLGELTPERILPGVPEEAFRGTVELHHTSAVVDRHDAVEGRPEHRTRVSLGKAARSVGGGRQGKDAVIGTVRRHHPCIVAAVVRGRPLVRGTPFRGLVSPCPEPIGARGRARRPGSIPFP